MSLNLYKYIKLIIKVIHFTIQVGININANSYSKKNTYYNRNQILN